VEIAILQGHHIVFGEILNLMYPNYVKSQYFHSYSKYRSNSVDTFLAFNSSWHVTCTWKGYHHNVTISISTVFRVYFEIFFFSKPHVVPFKFYLKRYQIKYKTVSLCNVLNNIYTRYPIYILRIFHGGCFIEISFKDFWLHQTL
jgi:hypothetical protein